MFIKNDKEVHQGPSILVVEIYSMIALRIFVLLCASTGELLPNKSILNKKISLKLSNLLSVACTSFMSTHEAVKKIARS